jgi:hypothetical protein
MGTPGRPDDKLREAIQGDAPIWIASSLSLLAMTKIHQIAALK